MRRTPFVVLLLLPVLSLTACASGRAPDGRVHVVVGAYPFAWLTQQIGSSDVDVQDLVPPGAEPHDIELSPRQVADVKDANLVVYLHGFQPAVDDAVAGAHGLDLGQVVTQVRSTEEAGAKDPHVWLDPVLMQTMATAVADRLAQVDPQHAAGYRSRATATTALLGRLEADAARALHSCTSHDIVTSHAAFAYFASRYGLVQRGIAGLSPDAEPSPERLAQVATFARAHHVTTIFFESLVSPKIAQTVASEVGAHTAVLDPIESVRHGDDYPTVFRRNVTALTTALGCS